jgi:hypothetical protein
MKTTNTSLITFFLLILFSLSQPLMANNTSERISGVAEFLIERANDNYLYIFQRKLQDNQSLSCYFPATYENLSVGGSSSLKRLLTSRDLWRNSIQSDLEFLTIRSLAVEIESTLKASAFSVEVASNTLDFVNLFSIRIDRTDYPLNVINPNLEPQTLAIINGFTFGLGQVAEDLNKFRKYKSLCPAPRVDIDAFKKEFESLKSLNLNFQGWLKHVRQYAHLLVVKDSAQGMNWNRACQKLAVDGSQCVDGRSTVNSFIQQKLASLLNPKIVQNINLIQEAMDSLRNNKQRVLNNAIRDAVCTKLNIKGPQCTDKNALMVAVNQIVQSGGSSQAGVVDSRMTYELMAKIKSINELVESLPTDAEDVTSQVFAALKKIKKQIEQELSQKYQQLEGKIGTEQATQEKLEALKRRIAKLDKLSHHILFFASVADANSASEVKSILSNYTLPSVSFFEKRKEGNHFMVSSYLGLSYNTDKNSQSEDSNNGLFVPIGLEYSRGVDWFGGSIRSASVMFSPVDFGHPVNLKLNNIEEDFELNEIIAPSVTFALGLDDYPLTFGVGYQKGRELEMSQRAENRVILFFAFDMPLLSLH